MRPKAPLCALRPHSVHPALPLVLSIAGRPWTPGWPGCQLPAACSRSLSYRGSFIFHRCLALCFLLPRAASLQGSLQVTALEKGGVFHPWDSGGRAIICAPITSQDPEPLSPHVSPLLPPHPALACGEVSKHKPNTPVSQGGTLTLRPAVLWLRAILPRSWAGQLRTLTRDDGTTPKAPLSSPGLSQHRRTGQGRESQPPASLTGWQVAGPGFLAPAPYHVPNFFFNVFLKNNIDFFSC